MSKKRKQKLDRFNYFRYNIVPYLKYIEGYNVKKYDTFFKIKRLNKVYDYYPMGERMMIHNTEYKYNKKWIDYPISLFVKKILKKI